MGDHVHEESKTKRGTSRNKKGSDKSKQKPNKREGKQSGPPRSASTANQTAQARRDEAANNVFVRHVSVHIFQPPTYLSRLRIHMFMKFVKNMTLLFAY